jgi:hypothetical protein
MKRLLTNIRVPILICILILSSATISISEKKSRSYTGSGVCAECHSAESIGDQFGKWKKTPHAKAVLILKTEGGHAIATRQSISDPSLDGKCLKCHTTGGGREPKLKDEGVGCEACHGAGGDYYECGKHVDTVNRQGGYATAQKNGMYPTLGIKNIKKREKLCLYCHTSNRPCYPSDPKEIYRQSISLQVISELRKGTLILKHQLIPPFPQY